MFGAPYMFGGVLFLCFGLVAFGFTFFSFYTADGFFTSSIDKAIHVLIFSFKIPAFIFLSIS